MTAPPPTELKPATRAHAAVLAPTGRDKDLLCELIASAGLECSTCADEAALIAEAEEERGPLLAAEEGLTHTGARELARRLTDQPDWSELPVIILTRGKQRHPQRLQPLHGLRGVRWLCRPVDKQSLLAVLETALDVRNRQLQVRNLLGNLRQMNKELSRRTTQLQKLAAALTEAKEEERRRLADILHEDLQQTLVAAKLHADMARSAVKKGRSPDGSLKQIMELLDESVDKSRTLSYELFPPALQDSELVEAFQWLRDVKSSQADLEVEVDVAPDVGRLDSQITKALYRAAQELLRNVKKHAGVSRARIEAQRNGTHVRVVISDEGSGFDARAAGHKDLSAGFGLFSIREHLESLGGRMDVDSREGEGSRFTLILPIELESSGDWPNLGESTALLLG